MNPSSPSHICPEATCQYVGTPSTMGNVGKTISTLIGLPLLLIGLGMAGAGIWLYFTSGCGGAFLGGMICGIGGVVMICLLGTPAIIGMVILGGAYKEECPACKTSAMVPLSTERGEALQQRKEQQ